MQRVAQRNRAADEAVEVVAAFRLRSAELPPFERGGDPGAAALLVAAASDLLARRREDPASTLRAARNTASAMKLILRDHLVSEAEARLN